MRGVTTLQSRLESVEQMCTREINAKTEVASEFREFRVRARDSRHEVDRTCNRLQKRASMYESEMIALRDDLVKARASKSKSIREAKERHEAELIRLRVRHSAEFDELNIRIRNVLGKKQRAMENSRSELSTALSRVRDLDGILSDSDGEMSGDVGDVNRDAQFLRGDRRRYNNDVHSSCDDFDINDRKRSAK